MIEVYAGDTALDAIKNEGVRQELFSNLLGASGGPKWFSLMGLDKYLLGEFFRDRCSKLNLIGSSAGAFRMACLAQKKPLSAIERFAYIYAESVFPKKSKPSDISNALNDMLGAALGTHGAEEIIENPIFKAHFIVAKSLGLVSCDNKVLQTIGLLQSYFNNKRSRKLLGKQYERFVFYAKGSDLLLQDPDNIPSKQRELTKKNLQSVLLASGSIPLLMSGVKYIPGSPDGVYRDGGIIDYHFDLSIQGRGLTLYPHFTHKPFAGWFDKSINRKVRAKSYDRTLFIVPSREFISSLPNGKIPDRNDFTDMEPSKRITYWKKVLKESERIAEAFDKFVHSSSPEAIIKPFNEIINTSYT